MNKPSNMKIFAVCGVKNSGKTTLITRILPILAAQGIRTAVIKHDGHDFEADVPGTDSWKYFQAGACGVAVFSRTKYMLVRESEAVSEEQLLKYFNEADLILLEGFKSGTYPKLEVIRNGNSRKSICTDAFLTAIATDLQKEKLETNGRQIPTLNLNDPQEVVAWICEIVGINGRQPTASAGNFSVPFLPDEHQMEIFVNGAAVVRLICTKENLKELAVGWLYNEGLLIDPSVIHDLKICQDGSIAEIHILDFVSEKSIPIRYTGLGSIGVGSMVNLSRHPIKTFHSLSYIRNCADEMSKRSARYAATGGMHAAALFDADGLWQFCEDIGRHNALDKLAGKCLLSGRMKDDMLLTVTGRISEDMVKKASRMGTAVIASYTTATVQARILAERLGITLIGYMQKSIPVVYCIEERIF